MSLTNFPNGASSFGIPVLGGAAIPFTGTYFFVDAVNGSNQGTSNGSAFASVYKAYSMCTSGNNDVIFIIGNGGTTATQRLSLANAQAVDSTVSAGTLVLNKNAVHIIGITAPTGVAQRCRFAPPTADR